MIDFQIYSLAEGTVSCTHFIPLFSVLKIIVFGAMQWCRARLNDNFDRSYLFHSPYNIFLEGAKKFTKNSESLYQDSC